jgi:hypothetical protein
MTEEKTRTTPLGDQKIVEMLENKIQLLEEDIACVHKYLDNLNAQKCDSNNQPYSIVGRIRCLGKAYLLQLSHLETNYLAKNQVKYK